MKPVRFIPAILTVVSLWTTMGMAKTTMMAFMPADTQFQTVLAGIRAELDTSYAIGVVDMSKPFTVQEVAKKCRNNDVKGLILMDRKAILAAQDLQKTDSAFATMPKFVYMTLMVEASTKGLSNVAGIKFEVPVYTLVTNFRIISQKDFSKVGIFYRKSYSNSIEEAKKLLSKEQFSLQTVCVDCEQTEKTTPQDALKVMKKSFDKMVKEQGSEVFLVLADNLVVNNASLTEFWIEKVKKKKVPVIAPLDMLASAQIGLAVFTADPDLPQLGAQAANQIVEFFENETPLKTIGFEPTISIKSTLNQAVAKEIGWKLKADKLGRINKMIK
jgi:ABC-type uncharacterized transport system substrate-binding protein